MPYNFSDFDQKFDKIFSFFLDDISTLRTGKASVQMLDPVQVEAYGSKMKINEVGNVSAPDPSLLVITPWDKSLLEAIEKAVSTSGLNLHPVVDGEIIRIAIPPLTEERRKEMVKLLHQKAEQGKVMIRTLRSDVKKEIENQEDQDGISEDDIKRDLDELEKKIKNSLEKIEKVIADKEKELLTV